MHETLAFDAFLLFLVVVVAIATVVTRNLMAAAALLAIYSLLMSLVWSNMWAMDVAFTEAAVGAGISTILVIGALVACGVREKKRPRTVHWPGLVVVTVTGAILSYGTWDMPAFGDPNAPIHQHVVGEYMTQSVGKIEGGPLIQGTPVRLEPGAVFPTAGEHSTADHHPADAAADATHHEPQTQPAAHDDHGHAHHGDFSHHAPNLVTPLLASYRGYDTMFETAVIFTAGISVILLLRARKEDDEASEKGPSA